MTFEAMQRDLADRLGGRGPSEMEHGTVVVVPSISFPVSELKKIIGIQHYEERLLCLLMFLNHSGIRVVFVTSMPVEERVVDYYLSFLDDPQDAKGRLDFVTLDDPEPRALSAKLIERPDRLQHLRSLVGEPAAACIVPFNVTSFERDLSERLGVGLYGPHPDLGALGSKSGSRRVATAAGAEVFPGAEDLYSIEEVERALFDLRDRHDGTRWAVIKLNNGFSGQGNAIVDLRALRSPFIESHVAFCASEESWPTFGPKIVEEGAIVEELARGPGITSPSVQMRIAPNGECELVSTHDQILGGPDEQVYLGCRFPARGEYRTLIQNEARKIARILSEKGVMGSFGIDFVVVPEAGRLRVCVSEINLRMGGTTHPFLMTRLATGGTYDESTGDLLVDGSRRFYVATDNLKSPHYKRLNPADVLDTLSALGLDFDHESKTGVTLHLLGAISEFGKLGLVCIAESRSAADALYERAVTAVDALAESGGFAVDN